MYNDLLKYILMSCYRQIERLLTIKFLHQGTLGKGSSRIHTLSKLRNLRNLSKLRKFGNLFNFFKNNFLELVSRHRF